VKEKVTENIYEVKYALGFFLKHSNARGRTMNHLHWNVSPPCFSIGYFSSYD